MSYQKIKLIGLYTIPIDDHAIVRGHAVFDTATVVNGYLYRHRVHVDRFFESAEKAGLDLNFLIKDNSVNKSTINTQKGKSQNIIILPPSYITLTRN